MQEFDPRQASGRYASRALLCLAAGAALAVGWSQARGQMSGGSWALDATTMAALKNEAFARAEAHPAFEPPPAQPGGLRGPAGPYDGALRLLQTQEILRGDTTVAQGRMSDFLYRSALDAGVSPELTAEVVRLFAHKLDFSRDIHPGDELRLVFNREAASDGGNLLYAEVGTRSQLTRFYRYQPQGAAEPEFFDQLGRNIRSLLLQTPVDGARVTSGFGLRLHPILGYTRIHQGIDFAAPVGAPVYAAGDGVVEEARWAGGYGRWLRIRHNDQWETGYGHLSGWTVRPGERVRQGEVVAYVGASGEATGPHLHYEVMLGGQKVNPKGAKAPEGAILEGRQLAGFRAEVAYIDGVLADAAPPDRLQLAQADAPLPTESALRGGQDTVSSDRLRAAER